MKIIEVETSHGKKYKRASLLEQFQLNHPFIFNLLLIAMTSAVIVFGAVIYKQL